MSEPKFDAVAWLREHAINCLADSCFRAEKRLLAAADELESARRLLEPNRLKTAVGEYLLSVNRQDEECPFIPPTAIDWLGNGIVQAILSQETQDG